MTPLTRSLPNDRNSAVERAQNAISSFPASQYSVNEDKISLTVQLLLIIIFIPVTLHHWLDNNLLS